MASHKRPLEHRMRGNSPPEKRNKSGLALTADNWLPKDPYRNSYDKQPQGIDTTPGSTTSNAWKSTNAPSTSTKKRPNDGLRVQSDLERADDSHTGGESMAALCTGSRLSTVSKPTLEVALMEQAQKSLDDVPSSTNSKMNILRKIKSRKQEEAHLPYQSTEIAKSGLTAQEPERLKSQDAEIQALKYERDDLAKRVKELEKLPTVFDELLKRIDKLEKASLPLSQSSDRINSPEATVSNTSQPHKIGIATAKPVLETHASANGKQHQESNSPQWIASHIEKYGKDLKTLNSVLEKVEGRVQCHQTCIDNLPATVSDTVRTQILVPFEKEMEMRLLGIEKTVQGRLKQSNLQDVETRQDMSNLKQKMNTHERSIDSKADATEMDNQMKNLSHSFKVLQDQYNNISTAEMHKKMVDYLVLHYPETMPGMIQQLSHLQQNVQRLQNSLPDLAWLASAKQQLDPLVAQAPLLQARSKPDLDLQCLPQALADSKKALETAKATESKTEERGKKLEAQITAASAVLDKRFGDFILEQEKAIANGKKTWNGTLDTIRTELFASVNCQSQKLSDLDQKVNKVQQAIDKYINPNRAYFDCFSRLFLAVAQLQPAVIDVRKCVEALNSSQPRKLRVNWNEDLHEFNLKYVLEKMEEH